MTGGVTVVGRSGQVAQALHRIGRLRGENISFGGRPDVDLTKLSSIEAFIEAAQPSVIVNAAAYTAVDKAESERDAAFAVNAQGAGELAAICGKRNIPIIHVSTDYVFYGSKTSPYVEDDLRKPLGVYGASKAAGEVAVCANASQHIILRTAWVYGPDEPNFVRTMLRLGQERDEVGVVCDQHGSPTHADDIATAIFDIAKIITTKAASHSIWGTYHFTNGGVTTWHGFAGEIFRHAKSCGLKAPILKAITTSDYPTPAKRPKNSVLDCTKIASIFGIETKPWDAVLAGKITNIIECHTSTSR